MKITPAFSPPITPTVFQNAFLQQEKATATTTPLPPDVLHLQNIQPLNTPIRAGKEFRVSFEDLTEVYYAALPSLKQEAAMRIAEERVKLLNPTSNWWEKIFPFFQETVEQPSVPLINKKLTEKYMPPDSLSFEIGEDFLGGLLDQSTEKVILEAKLGLQEAKNSSLTKLQASFTTIVEHKPYKIKGDYPNGCYTIKLAIPEEVLTASFDKDYINARIQLFREFINALEKQVQTDFQEYNLKYTGITE